MKPRVYNLIHLVAAIVLLASLGLSAAPGKTAFPRVQLCEIANTKT